MPPERQAALHLFCRDLSVGIINESEHTRLVGQALMGLLRAAGVTVIDCTIDQANTQNEYLAAAVALARLPRDMYQYPADYRRSSTLLA